MFTLVLVFVIFGNSTPDAYDRRTIQFPTEHACRQAQSWWSEHPQAELPGMDQRNQLLIGPLCQPTTPLTS